MNKGVFYAIGAYSLWGLLPIFWKALQGVAPIEVLAHRMVWSLVFMGVLLAVSRRWHWIRGALRSRRTVGTFLLTAALLGVNWFTYIWAVNAGFIVETSLGYFINPLLNVVLGVLFLGERPRRWQWTAVFIALLGVSYLTFRYGSLPWIALTLAFSFGFYGLLRKTAVLDAVEGLSFEIGILFLPALGFLLRLEFQGEGSFGHAGWTTTLLLAAAGVVTAVPLLLFAQAARRIPLTTIGILQYIAPTMQFLLGVFVYGEPFTRTQLTGFSLIWAALLVYTIEGIIVQNGQQVNDQLVPAGGGDGAG